MEVGISVAVLIALSESYRKDSVVPAELQTVHIEIALERVHSEIIVLHSVGLVALQAVDDNLRIEQVGDVCKCIFVAINCVNCDARHARALTNDVRRNFVANYGLICL